jgi:hypothetical protein
MAKINSILVMEAIKDRFPKVAAARLIGGEVAGEVPEAVLLSPIFIVRRGNGPKD